MISNIVCHLSLNWSKEIFSFTFHFHVKFKIVLELDEDKHFDVSLR